jgi:hypothetical protein
MWGFFSIKNKIEKSEFFNLIYKLVLLCNYNKYKRFRVLYGAADPRTTSLKQNTPKK